MSDVARIGDNLPPSQIEFSRETVDALSAWMKDNPVITGEEQAREAKLLIDRADSCSKDMDAERTALVKPLNDQVSEINGRYKEPKGLLSRVLIELRSRVNAFILREEEKRKAIAEEARRKAAEAERIAREAEEAEQRAKEEAKAGVLDLEIADFTANADHAFEYAKQAAREAQLATKAENVKIGGGFRRAVALRTRESLIIDDMHLALDALGLTDDIREAFLTSARKYRTHFGELPDGISSIKERK